MRITRKQNSTYLNPVNLIYSTLILFGLQKIPLIQSTNVTTIHAKIAERVTIKYVVTIADVLLDMQDTYAKQVN